MQKTVTPVPKEALSNQLHNSNTSAIQRYCQKAVGRNTITSLLQYEALVSLLSGLPGGLGYALRKHLYRFLFESVGHGLIFGKSIALRHPWKIVLGCNVAIDDNVLLDASGTGEEGLTIGDSVILSRNCTIQGKTGPVQIGSKTDIGCNVIISSVTGIIIEESVLIAGNCYIGGGRYFTERIDVPIMEQGGYSKGPLIIGKGSWLGAGVVVLDGVKIGQGCVIGAGSVVTSDLPDYAIAIGVPAKVVRLRDVTGEQNRETESL